MNLGTRSTELTKALTLNSRARFISESWFEVTVTEPANDTDSYPPRSGIHSVPVAGNEAPSGLKIYPYSEGDPGGAFWLRLWGWRKFGNDPATLLWIPCMLAEFLCIAGAQHGKANRLIKETEWFSGAIQATRGSAYVTNGATAYATVNLLGVQKIQFDIAPGDGAPAFGNALFAFL